MKNENVKKSLEKLKNVLEEKRIMVKRKNCIKKTNPFTNNCHELRSKAIKKHSRTSPDIHFKEYSLTKQKTRPTQDNDWIRKTMKC